MKIIKFQILLLIVFYSCKHKTIDKHKINEIQISKDTQKYLISEQLKAKKIEYDTVLMSDERLFINYNRTTMKYESDTIESKGIKLIAYGGFFNLDLSKDYIYTFIDSIKVIEPIKNTILTDELGGYLYSKNNYNFNTVIRVNDINRDGKMDIEVYCSICSRKNSIWEVYLNQSTKYEYSSDFSLSNLRFDEETNTYISEANLGDIGRNYSISTFEYDGESLIPINIETQEYDTNGIYIRTHKNLKTNTVKIESLKIER